VGHAECKLPGEIRLHTKADGQALLNNVGGSTIAAYDPQGKIFAVASSELRALMLYDAVVPDGVRAPSLTP
jgi:hypothetical protein